MLSLLCQLGRFDSIIEFFLLFVLFIEGLLTDFFELHPLFILVELLLEYFLLKFFLELYAHFLLLGQLLSLVDEFLLLAEGVL